MPGCGRSPDEMGETRAGRGPFSDPRQGRLLRQVAFAFWSWEAPPSLRPNDAPAVVTTNWLLSYCYPWEYYKREIKQWHREMVRRAARKVAIAVGRSSKGSGRPTIWRLKRPEALEGRTSHGRWKLGLPED
jgi:hypothetical protein